LLTIFAFDVLLRRSRIAVTPEGADIQISWLIFKKERNFAAADIPAFSVEQGMTVGHQAYYDLKIPAGAAGSFTAANSIADKPEADWLARQMNDILKRQ